MSVKKITKSAFGDFVYALIQTENVIGVQAKGDRFDFAPLESAKDLRLDYDVTLQPPKKFFLPPMEVLMTFEVGGAYASQLDDKKFILLGVHPYDMIAINQMDELFSQDNYDTHYMTRRKNATIVACDVARSSDHVFASSMNTAVVREGFDVLLTDIGDSYVMEVATAKGADLLARAKGAVDADPQALRRREEVWAHNKKSLNKHELKCDPAYLPRLLAKAYKHPIWEERAKTCFGCGSCNQVCPTCYCFNVQDDVAWDLQTGQRARAWDGCLLNGFTKCAPNHEFRKNQADRFRHRLYRKAAYVPQKIHGQIACVGCGRCIGACLPDIANPVSVYNRLIDDLGIG
ncbi:MAG: 4Fe-4S dicluster domain-containing protein [Phycisphaerales bacterium]